MRHGASPPKWTSLALLLVVPWVTPGHAQTTAPAQAEPPSAPVPPTPQAEDGTPALQPPKLVRRVEPSYPPAALAARIEGDVLLRLTIDASGAVGGVELLEAPSPELGEAAQAAARGFRFEPARRGEAAVASRIVYRHEFRLPEPDPAPVAAAFAAPVVPALPASDAPALSASMAGADVAVPSAPQTGPASNGRAIDVAVAGKRVEQRMRESAEAVKVVETRQAKKESADMGEVLARTPGVSIRRTGGLGKGSQISLNGFGGDRVQVFVDGVPLEYSGYPLDVADFPVNIVERVEIYSGVVPVRFGKDALGGVINIVTNQRRGSSAGGSYQVGSFGTQRATLRANRLFEDSGFFVGSEVSYDRADNDFLIDVEVPNDVGRLSPARVHRFHDGYQAYTFNLESGWLDRPWAEQLALRAFFSDVDQDVQNRGGRTIPYGSVTSGESSAGASISYTQEFGDDWSLDAIAGYTYTRSHLLDGDSCLYDWFGRCIRQLPRGELTRGDPVDQRTRFHALYARAQLAWKFLPNQQLLLALSPDYTTSVVEPNRFGAAEPGMPNVPLESDSLGLNTGLEHALWLFDERLENRLFVKWFVQHAYAEELEQVNDRGPWRVSSKSITTTSDPGIADGLRYRLTDWLWAKASYEYSTRVPTHEELFGDGLLVRGNPALEAERRHALNLGTAVLTSTSYGEWRGELGMFYRALENVIQSQNIGESRRTISYNVYSAASLGVEASAGWTAPGRWLVLDLNGTYQDYENTSSEGQFADYDGQRIPNTPWLFANAALRVQQHGAFAATDELALTMYLRYVHEYLLGWESIGRPETKIVIPSYVLPSVGLIYTVTGDKKRFSSSLELSNFTDTRVVDVYGLQRPGRAFYAKMTADF